MNDSIVSYLISLFSGLPTFIQLLLVLLLFPTGYTIYKFLNDEKLRSDVSSIKLLHRKKVEFNLHGHDLFSSEFRFYRYIENISFGDGKAKDEIFRNIIDIIVSSIINLSKEFIDKQNSGTKDSSINDFHELFDGIIVRWEEEILRYLTTKFGPECGVELYIYIYDGGFAPYNQNNINMVTRFIDAQRVSIIPNIFKVYSILNMFSTFLDSIIFDCEKVFYDFNGGIVRILEKYDISAND